MKSIFIPAFAGILLLAGCNDPSPPVPDYTPVGDGMKSIGICLVVAAVVKALAELVKAGENQTKDEPPSKTRKTRGSSSKGGDQ